MSASRGWKGMTRGGSPARPPIWPPWMLKLAMRIVACSTFQVLVDHAMHVEHIGLLPGIQAEAREDAGVHAGLHFEHVRVVLVRDESPVAVAPVLEHSMLGHVPSLAGTRPLEHPRVLDRAVGVEAVRTHSEQDGAAGIDRSDHVR